MMLSLPFLTSPLEKDGVISLPMIQFRLLTEKIDYQGCDTLMFTSKQAVASADEIDPEWKKYPAVAIGGATAMEIKRRGGKVLYHPEKFYGKHLADDIASFFSGGKILYLRPREISFDSKGFLAEKGIALKEFILYETVCRRYSISKKPPENSVIIFTSPSTIHCFLKNFGWLESYTAVVIGEATLVHLPDSARYVIAEEPRIDACISAARQKILTN